MNAPQAPKFARNARDAFDIRNLSDAGVQPGSAMIEQRPLRSNKRRRIAPYLAFFAIALSSMVAAVTLASADAPLALTGLY